MTIPRFLLSLSALLLLLSSVPFTLSVDDSQLLSSGGGYTCVACTAGNRNTSVLSLFRLKWIGILTVDFMEALCTYLPADWQKECKAFVIVTVPIIDALIQAEISPDNICRKLNYCYGDDLKCTLYPEDKTPLEFPTSGVGPKFQDSGDIPSPLQQFLERVLGFNVMKKMSSWNQPLPDPPIEHDGDRDRFSTDFFEYGTALRGRDCNDSDPHIYPGRGVASDASESGSDYDCNGIYGVSSHSGRTWKDELCGGTDRRGIISIGGSACAHFRVPQQLLAPDVKLEEFRYLTNMILLEMDWPHLGYFGGFMHDNTGLTPGDVRSLYLYAFERNRCNHRDYQTLCVNGVSSPDVVKSIPSITRVQTDHPAVVFISPLGNDVCKESIGWKDVTTPLEFYNYTMESLRLLNGFLPPESHVVFNSLMRGTLLYQFLADRTHPFGRTYAQVYDYLICLKKNPCWGWLNSNETVRNITQQKADALSAEYVRIIKDHSPEFRFKMHYLDTGELVDKMVKDLEAQHLDPAILVEPIDGFHPSQVFIPMFADKMYDFLRKEDPTIFGSVNPNNEKIFQLFGDQGGY